MRVCPNCNFKDSIHWRHSRFDFNADYMRFDTAKNQPELKSVVHFLKDKGNFIPFHWGPFVFYRRGKGGLYLYRVEKEDFKVNRERKKH